MRRGFRSQSTSCRVRQAGNRESKKTPRRLNVEATLQNPSAEGDHRVIFPVERHVRGNGGLGWLKRRGCGNERHWDVFVDLVSVVSRGRELVRVRGFVAVLPHR